MTHSTAPFIPEVSFLFYDQLFDFVKAFDENARQNLIESLKPFSYQLVREFFIGVDWERLTHSTAPFIPEVSFLFYDQLFVFIKAFDENARQNLIESLKPFSY